MVKINLKRLIGSKGITQSELAEMTGIRPSTISDLCNNNAHFLKTKNIDKICAALHCGISELITFTPPQTEVNNEGSEFI